MFMHMYTSSSKCYSGVPFVGKGDRSSRTCVRLAHRIVHGPSTNEASFCLVKHLYEQVA